MSIKKYFDEKNWNYSFLKKIKQIGVLAGICQLFFYFVLTFNWDFYDNFTLRMSSFFLSIGLVFLPEVDEFKIIHKMYLELYFFISLPVVFFFNLMGNLVDEGNFFANVYWLSSICFCGFIYGLVSFQAFSLMLFIASGGCAVALALIMGINLQLPLLACLVGGISLLMSSVIRYTINLYIGKLKQAHKAIEEEKLEVMSLNRIIEEKSRAMSLILANIHQGIFILNKDMKIDPQYSSYLKTLFDEADILDKDIRQLFLNRLVLSGDQVCQIEGALMCIGDADFTFELNSAHLPKEVRFMQSSERDKVMELEASWDPIIIDETIFKIIVSLRDVTELRELKKSAAKQKSDSAKVIEIVESGLADFYDHLESIFNLLRNSKKTIESSMNEGHLTRDCLQKVYINLHTIKGNARFLQLRELVDITHAIEQYYDQLLKKPEENILDDYEKMFEDLDQLNRVVTSYCAATPGI